MSIPFWEYGAYYDEMKNIFFFFFFSPITATTGLKVFIKLHTRRMGATHLYGENLPFFFTQKFPISKLQHLSLHIAAGAGGNDNDHAPLPRLDRSDP